MMYHEEYLVISLSLLTLSVGLNTFANAVTFAIKLHSPLARYGFGVYKGL